MRKPVVNYFSVVRLTLVLLIFYISRTVGHVGLTYPPARSFDLDFLDNVRSKSPCGMPKGKTGTTLVAGSLVNVTWHLAYPHRGGYRLELLDKEEKFILDLKTGKNTNDFVQGDPTAQWHTVTIPKDLICDDCSIRLLRQASEWSNGYQFWSCADVRIVSKGEYKEDCLGRGTPSGTGCQCHNGYWGPRCQYQDECGSDADCKNGKCIDLGGTSLPRKQCFCSYGYHGEKCDKRNKDTLPNQSTLKLNDYTKEKFSDRMSMYYKIIPATEKCDNEMEFVLVVNGTSYGAVGWRPEGLNKTCKLWPYVDDDKERLRKIRETSKSKMSKAKNYVPNPTLLRPLNKLERSMAEPEPKFRNKQGSKDNEVIPSNKEGSAAEPEPEKSVAEAEPEPEKSAVEPEPEHNHSKHNKHREGSPEPESEPEKSVGKPVSGKSAAEPEPEKSAPEPEPEKSVSEPEPEKSVAEPEPEKSAAEPEPEKSVSEPEPEKSAAEPEKSAAEPEPEKSAAEPEPEKSIAELEPEKSAAEPEPEKSAAESEPEKSAAEPEPEKSAAEPEPEKSAAEPEPEKSAAEPEPEKSAGEPEPEKSAAEPEPEKSAAEPEPEHNHTKPKASHDSSSEPESEPEKHHDGSPEPEPSISQTSQLYTKERSKSPYSPKGDFHAMDCTDIVMGSARGQLSRIRDYYTRDRSSPKPDVFWGGTDGLTSATGWETDNSITYLIFRRKIQSLENTDHPIEGLMQVIWARGQQQGQYVHSPKSGLEVESPSIPNFYFDDEIKYHGHRSQRGVSFIDFNDIKS